MDTATLKQIFLEELDKYTGEGLNDRAFLTANEGEGIYSIIDIAQIRGREIVGTVLVARLVEDRVVIDLDRHDKLLIDALKARGVPADQIVFRGESVSA